MKLDADKPPMDFQDNQGEDIKVCVLAMMLYFIANPFIVDVQKPTRTVLNFSGPAKKWLYNLQRTRK